MAGSPDGHLILICEHNQVLHIVSSRFITLSKRFSVSIWTLPYNNGRVSSCGNLTPLPPGTVALQRGGRSQRCNDRPDIPVSVPVAVVSRSIFKLGTVISPHGILQFAIYKPTDMVLGVQALG